MNLCNSCVAHLGCPIGAPGTPFCVEYQPRTRADCRAAQLLVCAQVGERDGAWLELYRLIEHESRFDAVPIDG